MSFRATHELHNRRAGRNIGLAVVLISFIAIIFGLTVAKVTGGSMMQAFDHVPRASILPQDPAPSAAPPATQPAAQPQSAPVQGD
ncbi:MAG: hypothetical protein ACNA7O_18520 [Rhodobacterales bacterium]